jgi:hypothetical protein
VWIGVLSSVTKCLPAPGKQEARRQREPRPGSPASPTVGQAQEKNTSVMDPELVANRTETAGLFFKPAGSSAPRGATKARRAESAPASEPSADQNPLAEYPKLPFPPQTQEPPGPAVKMSLRPDHGENSYKGAGRLTGRKALVTGDSGMGLAAAIAFARKGADAAINYESGRVRGSAGDDGFERRR